MLKNSGLCTKLFMLSLCALITSPLQSSRTIDIGSLCDLLENSNSLIVFNLPIATIAATSGCASVYSLTCIYPKKDPEKRRNIDWILPSCGLALSAGLLYGLKILSQTK